MTDEARTNRHPSSNAVARERDAMLMRLLVSHPATAGMVAGIGLFPSRKKASKRLRRLVQRGLIKRLGTVSLKDGRPEHVFGRGRWKADNLLHEVQLTRVCLKIDADELRRGAREVDATLLPDAEFRVAGRRFCLEMDCGTMSYPDVVRRRFAKYSTCPDFVVWVCPNEVRMEGLRRHAATIRTTALFTTLDRALTDPHDMIWIDVDGGRAALPRSNQGGDDPGKVPGAKGGDNPGPFAPPASGAATLPSMTMPQTAAADGTSDRTASLANQ